MLCVILAAVMLVYAVRIFDISVISSDKYYSQISGYSTRTAVIKAPRGEILDCFGREIATNRDGYNIVFNKAYVDPMTLNDVILSLCDLLKEKNTEWTDKLPLSKEPPYSFTEEDNTSFLSKIGLARYATAANAFDRLVEMFTLQEYSDSDKRTVMGVRYSMLALDFSVSNPFVLSEDVSAEIMQKVSESGFMLDGVTVDVVPFRKYTDSSLAPNLIGTVGPIYAEEWEELRDKGYGFNDKVGKSGIEKYAEDYLRGKDGIMTYVLDKNGAVISSEVTQAPVPGKSVMLTLDKSLQKTAQEVLKEYVGKTPTATGAAAVIKSATSGKILASANYPSYDLATLSKDYDKLVKDPANPLLDRAFQGIYPIGSSIKPIVALAGIDGGVLTPTELIDCKKTYTLFKDYRPNCMGLHGPINLKTALARSCNYYFFEVGRRVGAAKLTEYFKNFGLGVPTGVEIDDSSALIADVDEGSGDTLQIAIGQKNAFTTLQLAVYASTLANGGTRYRATLIDKVISPDTKTVYLNNAPEVLSKVDVSDYALKAVKEGMLSVIEEGTASYLMHDYPIKVGGKTGTSQTNSGVDHGVYVAFAPYENPEIVITIIVEHGASGSSAGSVLKKLLDGYFFTDNTTVDMTPSYSPLK